MTSAVGSILLASRYGTITGRRTGGEDPTRPAGSPQVSFDCQSMAASAHPGADHVENQTGGVRRSVIPRHPWVPRAEDRHANLTFGQILPPRQLDDGTLSIGGTDDGLRAQGSFTTQVRRHELRQGCPPQVTVGFELSRYCGPTGIDFAPKILDFFGRTTRSCHSVLG